MAERLGTVGEDPEERPPVGVELDKLHASRTVMAVMEQTRRQNLWIRRDLSVSMSTR